MKGYLVLKLKFNVNTVKCCKRTSGFTTAGWDNQNVCDLSATSRRPVSGPFARTRKLPDPVVIIVARSSCGDVGALVRIADSTSLQY
jgi:hypothetical protein